MLPSLGVGADDRKFIIARVFETVCFEHALDKDRSAFFQRGRSHSLAFEILDLLYGSQSDQREGRPVGIAGDQPEPSAHGGISSYPLGCHHAYLNCSGGERRGYFVW